LSLLDGHEPRDILILLVTGAGVVVSALNTLSIIGPMD
jgi:hypothetical protein